MRFVNNIIFYGLVLLTVANSVSCRKFLEEKPNASLATPTAIEDLRALLDDYLRLNTNYPGSGEASCDDFFLNYSDWQSRNEYLQRTYIWDKVNLLQPGNNNDWTNAYRMIYAANVVLDELSRIARRPENSEEWDNVKGSALFLRASCYIQLAWIFSPAFDSSTANSDLGLVLRTSPDFNILSVRSSVWETYGLIVRDFKEAAALLSKVPIHVMRPSKPAAYGWLTRTYLSMRMYDSAFVFADKYLQEHNELMDYNLLNASATAPIQSFNREVVYHSTLTSVVSASVSRVDSVLYNSYDLNDLRKSIMFGSVGTTGQFRFKGSYDGNTSYGAWFNGIATDEIYLSRAECYARAGDIARAMNDLNTLMKERWNRAVVYEGITASTKEEAVAKILTERRKELCMRGLRWMDLKRLNKEGANIILTRKLNSDIYSLLPNSNRYVLPIPDDVITMTGIQQNER